MRVQAGWTALVAVALVGAAHAVALSVTDVRIAQRYPWNGLVDITYTVNCDDPAKDVWIYPVGYDADNDESVALMPQHLTGEGVTNAVKTGTHRMVWDMSTAMGTNYNRAAFSVRINAYCDAAPYMVLDLSSGSSSTNYPVSYLTEEPSGGWTDEYKTTKMVFRMIPPGTFKMQNTTPTTLTRPYYCAVFPLTEQQYRLVAGGTATTDLVACHSGISYDELRGTMLGSKWPQHQQVDADSFVGKLRLRTGVTIDLPTDAQWEYAARAGTSETNCVSPNAWGIYDVGVIAEWVLDWGSDDIIGGVDPAGPAAGQGGARTIRGVMTLGYNVKNNMNFDNRTRGPLARAWRFYYGRVRNGYLELSNEPILPAAESLKYSYDNGGPKLCGLGARLVALPVCK